MCVCACVCVFQLLVRECECVSPCWHHVDAEPKNLVVVKLLASPVEDPGSWPTLGEVN